MTDVEWQLRNWLYFTWLSGDHIVEQHVHNLDVINWALGNSHPITRVGMGGRQVRTAAEFGHIFDHFAIDYEYPNGVHVLSMCPADPGLRRQRLRGASPARAATGPRGGYTITGERAWNFPRRNDNDPYQAEHVASSAASAAPQRINDLQRVRKHADRHHGPHGGLHRQGSHLGPGAQLAAKLGARTGHLGHAFAGRAGRRPWHDRVDLRQRACARSVLAE